jgi:hypothetical protein
MLNIISKIIKKEKFTYQDAIQMQAILMVFAILVIGGQRLELVTHFTNEVIVIIVIVNL